MRRITLILSVVCLSVTLMAQNNSDSGLLRPGQTGNAGPRNLDDCITWFYNGSQLWFDLPESEQTVTVSIEAPSQNPQMFYNVDEYSRLSISQNPATYTITCITVLGKEYSGTITIP